MNSVSRMRELLRQNVEAMKTASPAIRAELERENEKLKREIFNATGEVKFQGVQSAEGVQHFSANSSLNPDHDGGVNSGDQDKRSMMALIDKLLPVITRDDGVQLGRVLGGSHFAAYSAAAPYPAVTGEVGAGHSTKFLTKINVVPVTDLEGERVLIGSGGSIASVNNSGVRNPNNGAQLRPHRYLCCKVNFDAGIPYDSLDSWVAIENYPEKIKEAIDRQRGLDRILIGFHGTHYAGLSDPSVYPKRQDCGVGWLEKYRQEAPQRIISGLSVAERDDTNKIIAPADYGTIDALVLDGWQSAIAPQYRNGLVSICSAETLFRKEYPYVRHLSPDRPNYEHLVNEIMLKNPTIGGLPAVVVPFFPDDAVWVTSLSNISLYWQKGSIRKQSKDEPDYNRLALYESRNDAYMVQNYDAGCLIDGIAWND